MIKLFAKNTLKTKQVLCEDSSEGCKPNNTIYNNNAIIHNITIHLHLLLTMTSLNIVYFKTIFWSFFNYDKISAIIVFVGATGGVMLHTNMELPVLPVQLAMLEAAGTISATKVGLEHTVVVIYVMFLSPYIHLYLP